jgi:hypothetical protein
VNSDTGVKYASDTEVTRQYVISCCAGCGGRIALNPSLMAQAQEGDALEWGGRGGEVVWRGCRLNWQCCTAFDTPLPPKAGRQGEEDRQIM